MTAEAAPAARRISLGTVAWWICWALTAAIAIHIFWWDLSLVRWNGDRSIGGAALWGRDFVNVYTSGSLVLGGRVDIVYDVEAYRAWQLGLFDQSLAYHNYSYPPVTLLYTWLFALIPYPLALAAWLGGTGAFFVWAARPYLRGVGLPAWLAVLAPASIVNIWAGHYGFLIGGLWLAAFHSLPRRPVLAGILIGCMIVKPHLAVLAPIVLLCRRDWRAVAAAALTSGGLVLVSLLIFGPELWRVYLTGTALMQAAMVDNVRAFFITMMPTLMPSLAIIGVGTGVAMFVQALAATAAIGLLVWKLPRDAEAAGLAAAAATFLVLPYAFAYDMTVAGLAALLLFQRARARRSWLSLAVGAMAFLLPMLVLYLNSRRVGVPIAPLVIAAQLLALLGLIGPRTERR